jgi:hypothetical protein
MTQVADPGNYDATDPVKVQREAQAETLLQQWNAPPACLKGH